MAQKQPLNMVNIVDIKESMTFRCDCDPDMKPTKKQIAEANRWWRMQRPLTKLVIMQDYQNAGKVATEELDEHH
jgi:hypothetical protein